MYKVKMSKKDGRGLYATRDIKKGTVLTDCELIILTLEETWYCDQTRLKYYMFQYHDEINRGIIVLGDGMLFNHRQPDNVSYRIIKKAGREFVRYRTSRAIKKGEQLFIDYTKDAPINIEEYMEK